MRKIKVGARASKLAVVQAEIVMNEIKKYDCSIELSLVKISTTGDKILDKTLNKIGGKKLFVKEIEKALLDHEIDIAVHSYKDMPYEELSDLPIVALSKREDPRDVLILPNGILTYDYKKPIGTSSLRREVQIKEIFEKVQTIPIRGNVNSRIEKLDNGEFGGIILAMAGLNRLNISNRVSRIFSPDEMIPSTSQGILAVQGRKGEDFSYLEKFHNLDSEDESKGEREVQKLLNGGCSAAFGVFAKVYGNEIKIMAMFAYENNQMKKASISGDRGKAKELGEKLSKMLKGM